MIILSANTFGFYGQKVGVPRLLRRKIKVGIWRAISRIWIDFSWETPVIEWIAIGSMLASVERESPLVQKSRKMLRNIGELSLITINSIVFAY